MVDQILSEKKKVGFVSGQSRRGRVGVVLGLGKA